MVSYNTRQQIFSLNMASNVVAAIKEDQQDLQALATEKLNAIFSNPDVQALIGKWELVWGAAVYQHDGQIIDSQYADSVMYMAKSLDSERSDRYVIAIAGTNPASLFGWAVEDFWVSKTRLWNQGRPWESDPEDQTTVGKRVSAGTSVGLRILLEDMKSNDKSLLDYLREQMNNASKPVSITVCGHSLGGALSPTLALSLMDRRSDWDPESKATLLASPSAGATPGNDLFAEYYDSQLGDVTDRIWHYLDFVPHGWGQDTLEETKTFYNPYITTTTLINLFVDLCLDLSERSGVIYKDICSKQEESFTTEYNPDAPNVLGNFTASFLSKLIARMIFRFFDINPTPDQINFLSEIIKPIIEELMGISESSTALDEQKIKIAVAPYVQQIREKLPTEGLIAKKVAQEVENDIIDILSSIGDFTKYLSQALYQHVDPYCEYLGINEFMGLIS